MFRVHVLIISRSNLHYTASGIITPIGGRLVRRLREAVLSFVAFLDLQYFSTFWNKWRDFEKKLPNTKCVLIFSTTFVWNISHYKKKWIRYDKNVYWYSSKVPVILVRFEWNLDFLESFFFRKILKYQISSKSFQWERSCSMLSDR